jgi:hypothetical protein
MIKLSIEQRSRIIQLYGENNLHFGKNKFEKLKKLAEKENKIANKLAFKKLIICIFREILIFTYFYDKLQIKKDSLGNLQVSYPR